ncbi:MAG: DUF4178 domain-containing protein [Oscillospiraceae bacterium]|nr:DUF4178 domain-containing protein [Oscillospiraceae bacterium]
MKFSRGDVLLVDGVEYVVLGSVTYRNTADGNCWDEYRMQKTEGASEVWLSIDDVFSEYSVTHVVGERCPSLRGYHIVDHGHEVVIAASGSVDVVPGDQADFNEYEDDTEEKIISEELWSDGAEYSTGHYVDAEDIFFSRHDKAALEKAEAGIRRRALIITALALMVFFLPLLGFLFDVLSGLFYSPQTISHYLSRQSKTAAPRYSYVTSVTGEAKQKADVYSAGSAYSIDFIAEDIITAIEGETEYVQKDDEAGEGEEGSVAILTKKEYCLVYPSEDNNEVLVQVSKRKFAYTTDESPYRSNRHARRYYRRFYYSTGYSSDSSSYRKYSSPYSSFDDTSISYSDSNSLNTYSGTVRQDSINARRSDGGGLSNGK